MYINIGFKQSPTTKLNAIYPLGNNTVGNLKIKNSATGNGGNKDGNYYYSSPMNNNSGSGSGNNNNNSGGKGSGNKKLRGNSNNNKKPSQNNTRAMTTKETQLGVEADCIVSYIGVSRQELTFWLLVVPHARNKSWRGMLIYMYTYSIYIVYLHIYMYTYSTRDETC